MTGCECDGIDLSGMLFGVIALQAFLIVVLAVVIVWPLEGRRVRVDAMAEPFGDQPRVPS